MKKNYIILASLFSCILLYFFEQVLGVNYAVKTISKIILFTAIPYIYLYFVKKSSFKKLINCKKIGSPHLKVGLLFGIASFFIVLTTYYLTRNAINIQSIAGELQSKSGITPANFIMVGLYITFGNSFLEEFFFRGFVFLNLYESGYKKTAYTYSSLLFALYHIAIFKTWFNIWLTGLALLGLITVGFIFNWLDTKSENFINSWLVHILADTAVILIGMEMFGII